MPDVSTASATPSPAGKGARRPRWTQAAQAACCSAVATPRPTAGRPLGMVTWQDSGKLHRRAAHEVHVAAQRSGARGVVRHAQLEAAVRPAEGIGRLVQALRLRAEAPGGRRRAGGRRTLPSQ